MTPIDSPDPASMRRATARRHLPLLCLLALHAGMLAWCDYRYSPTYDEVGHLPAGLAVWQYGRFDLYRVNPPLVRALAALPVSLLPHEVDWSSYSDGAAARPEWSIGADFINSNGSRAFWLFTVARWACIPFSLLGAIICWRWANELYGPRAALLATTLWCFSPDVIGNGALITPDVAAAACGLLAADTFWRWLRRPTWTTAIVAGAALGLAELSKMTWIILFGLWPLMALVSIVRDGGASRRTNMAESDPPASGGPERPASAPRRGLQLALLLFIAVDVLNMGYLFQGSLQRLDRYEFVSTALGGAREDTAASITGNRFRGTPPGAIPVPLPRDYLTGLDLQKLDFEQGRVSYLRGEFQERGWWYYYLYAAVVKLPLGLWLLGLVTIATRCGRPGGFRAPWCLWLPPLAVVLLVSSQTGFSRYFRYVLPALPFVFVWVSQCAALWERSRDDSLASRSPLSRRARKVAGGIAAAAALWYVGSSLWCYPHSLSYFNELAGGPTKGHEHLIDANIDWGQDLFYLRDWIEAHPEARPLTVAYQGFFDEKVAGVDFPRTPAVPPRNPLQPRPVTPGDGPQPGWHAISVNYLRHPSHLYDYFLDFEPAAYAGFSIPIYHLTPEQAARARRKWLEPNAATGIRAPSRPAATDGREPTAGR